MLKFNPANYLIFTPNSESKLQTSFIISNPSNNCSAPFKIKSTNTQIFTVRPHVGVILPLQQVQVTIKTIGPNSNEFAKEIANQHKFRVEYSMLQSPPINIGDALKKITDQNKQIHKLYISTPTSKATKHEDYIDSKSALSDRYKTVRDQNQDIGFNRYQQPFQNYKDMNNEQKFQHLRKEIDKVEKDRSQAIMAAKPHKNRINFFAAILIFVFMVVVGNFSGKLFGIKSYASQSKSQQRQYRYMGLERLWAAEEEPPKSAEPWWKFWS